MAMERRFDVDLAVGAHAELVGQLRAFTAVHPLRERPRGQLMLALYRCGRQAEALEAFSRLPPPARGRAGTGALRTACARSRRRSCDRRPSSTSRQPASKSSAEEHPTCCSGPGRTTARRRASSVGSEDIAEAAARIGEARLVTLTGIGGVGKTRLARRAAVAVSGQFADGVSWCELAPLTEPAAVAPALATSLGVRRQPDAGVVDSVARFLAPKRLLLVLDNCEHVLDGVRPLVEAILRGCPRVVVLATSRERLGINGERVQPVAPLPLARRRTSARPRRLRRSPCSSTGPAPYVLTSSSARPTWPRSSACADDLDGLPLSLELAAARIRSLNPADLSARMAGHLDLLSPAGLTRDGTAPSAASSTGPTTS